MVLKCVLQVGNKRVSCTAIHVYKKICSHRRASVTLALVHARKQKKAEIALCASRARLHTEFIIVLNDKRTDCADRWKTSCFAYARTLAPGSCLPPCLHTDTYIFLRIR